MCPIDSWHWPFRSRFSHEVTNEVIWRSISKTATASPEPQKILKPEFSKSPGPLRSLSMPGGHRQAQKRKLVLHMAEGVAPLSQQG